MWERCGKLIQNNAYLCIKKFLDIFAMACTFIIKKDVKSGMTPVMLKVRSRKLNVDVRQTLKVEVDAYKWKNAHSTPNALANFRKSQYGQPIFAILDKIAADMAAPIAR